MNTFIEDLASKLLESSNDLSNTIVVFPNRRPALFLRRAIGKLTDKPVFAPQMFSIRDFVFHYSDVSQTDSITLLFRLYHVYCKLNQESENYEFEHFLSSGELMLADFNDIDNYMVDPADLFSNLDQAKAIEMWNPGKSELTEKEKQYLEFFQKLYRYYDLFKQDLKEQGLAFDGMAYRKMAEDIQQGVIFAEEGKKYVFAGFNALNNAEMHIIDHFVHHGAAKLFWDADVSYVSDENQEAGAFLRNNLEKWQLRKTEQEFEDRLFSTQKNIHIVGAPLSLSQARYTGQILRDIYKNHPAEINNTVVVPSDETTLGAILESIPPEIEDINVTMGYSLQQSLIYRFIELYVKMFVKSATSLEKGREIRLYYEDLVIFLRHPLFKHCAYPENHEAGELLSKAVFNQNRLFYSLSNVLELEQRLIQLSDLKNSCVSDIFPQVKGSKQLIVSCIRLCDDIEENMDEDEIVELAMIRAMRDVLSLLAGYVETAGFVITLSGFSMLLQRLGSSFQVPFEGEPLGGLQLMGFLETRCLDFKNIIITNCNEGHIPAGSKRMLTFIPFDLRRSFGMPMPSHKDAMYAYYFLRLIQRAENVWILYNTEPDPVSGKEMSRFIRQIEYEFVHKASGNWNVSHKILQIFPGSAKPDADDEGVEKTEEILQILENKIHKGYSASRLFNYLECPYRFYLAQVLKIEEPRSEVPGSVEMNVLGTVVHETLSLLYKNTENIRLGNIFFDESEQKIQDILISKFEEYYPGGNMKTGKNLIVFEVAKQMVKNVLKADRQLTENYELVPLMIEKTVHAEITAHKGKTYALQGKFDRVDRLNEQVRIVDYKTGKTDSLRLLKKNMMPEELDFWELDAKKFQLLFYLLLFMESEDTEKLTKDVPLSGIVSLKKSSVEFKPLEYSDKQKEITEELIDDFKGFVAELIAQIHDPSVPFFRTSDTNKCSFCVYTSICNYFAPITEDENDNE